MKDLEGARILIVDHDIFLAVHLTDKLLAHKAAVPTVAPTLQRLRRATEGTTWDAAVVDPLLDDGEATPTIQAILEHEVPVIVTTLGPRSELPNCLAGCSFIRKPYAITTLISGLVTAIGGQSFVCERPCFFM